VLDSRGRFKEQIIYARKGGEFVTVVPEEVS